MSLTNLATTATAALWWYHLPHEGQYRGANAHLYERLAKKSGREEYADIVTAAVSNVDGPILEIGAGTGLISRKLAERHGERLLCTDIEPSALALNPHSRKHVADCRKLPVTDGSIDAVVGVGIYRYLKQEALGEFWREMRRVIHASGKLVIGEFYPRFIGMRGTEVDVSHADGLFSFHTCQISPAHIQLGRRVLRAGTNVTYTFLPE